MTQVERVKKVVEEMERTSWGLYEYFKENSIDENMAKQEFREWSTCHHFLKMLEDKEYLETMESIYLGAKEN